MSEGKHHRTARAARNALAALALAAALAALPGCGNDDSAGGLTAAQSDEAQSLLHDYDQARRNRDWAGAAKIAETLRRKYPDSEPMAKVRQTLDEVVKNADAAADAGMLAALWTYQQVPAGAGTQYTAMISSHVEEDANGAPLGEPDARLVVRVHPDWGKSVYLLLAQKEFACGEPCTLQIAFDDAPAQEFAGKQADSGQGPALFIEDYTRFHSLMRTSQTVRIMLPKTGGFAPTLRFDVGGYDADKLGTFF
jgi:hypothetical protein